MNGIRTPEIRDSPYYSEIIPVRYASALLGPCGSVPSS